MAVNVQEPHEMPALIDTQTRKLCAQLLGAMMRRKAGHPPSQAAAPIDDQGIRGRPRGQRQGACGVLIRRARADKFESASSAAKPSRIQTVAPCQPKKPDTYWSALRGRKRPVISVVEI